MSMTYIRTHYGVSAKRGMILDYAARDGEDIKVKVVGSRGHYLRVRLKETDGSWGKRTVLLHPTWNLAYPSQRNGDAAGQEVEG